jgi:folate-binding protein YgfZ
VRAAFTVTFSGGSFLLLQDPLQPRSVLELLEPYVLSSDVRLEDRSEGLAVFALPGLDESPDLPGGASSTPSALGRGIDAICPAEERERVLASFSRTFVAASEDDVEAWRVAAGVPRFGIDGEEGDLPMECGLEDAVSREKGCFPGQEAVAKVRNLGHPRRVLLHLEATEPVRAGEAVTADGGDVGVVTSAARFGDRWRALARVRWEARASPLRTGSGALLRPVDRSA